MLRMEYKKKDLFDTISIINFTAASPQYYIVMNQDVVIIYA